MAVASGCHGDQGSIDEVSCVERKAAETLLIVSV